MLNFNKLSIVVTTHNRPQYLIDCVSRWVATLPFYRRFHILVNHPNGAINFSLPERGHIVHTGRVPEHSGCMAKTWNLAFQWGFRDSEVEWLLCSMDDAYVLPGWEACLSKFPAEFYLAPAGDIVFLISRNAFKTVGWFDERFPTVGYQEWDYQARAIRSLGLERVSLQDAHGWNHNAVGLSEYWQHIGGGANPTTRDMTMLPHGENWLRTKWGKSAGEFVSMLAGGKISDPLVPEYEWYPWFLK